MGRELRWKRFSAYAGAEVSYIGERRATDTNIVDNGAVYTLPAYVMVNANISTQNLHLIADHLSTFTLSVRNLLDVTGPDPGFNGIDYPLKRRSVMLYFTQEL